MEDTAPDLVDSMSPEDIRALEDLFLYMQETARRCQRGLIGSRTVFCALEDIFKEGQTILNRYREDQEQGQITYAPGEVLDILHFHQWPSRHQVQLLRDLIELDSLLPPATYGPAGNETIDGMIVNRASKLIKELTNHENSAR